MNTDWMQNVEGFEIRDAREADPGDFFPMVNALGDALLEGQGVHIIQSFDPVPLYAVMKAKGLVCDTKQVGADEVHVFFFRPPSPSATSEESMATKMGSHMAVEPQRIEAIEALFMAFYDGANPADLKLEFDNSIGTITGPEFAYVEQKMTEHGIKDDDFMERVEDLIGIFKQSLQSHVDITYADGHPLNTLVLENKVLTDLANEMRAAGNDTDSQTLDTEWWADALARLWQVDIHYARKENQLFPPLEERGFDKPSTVMWQIHDEVRDGIKALRRSFDAGSHADMLDQLPAVLDQLIDMTFKEEKILIPTCEAMLSMDDFIAVRRGEEEIGYCLVEDPPAWPAR